MSYFAVLLNAEFGYSPGRPVKADHYEIRSGSLLFYLDERLVYQVPSHYIRDVKSFETQAEAARFFKEERRKHREGGNLAVLEVGTVSRSKSAKRKTGKVGIPAEKISVQIEELGRAKKS